MNNHNNLKPNLAQYAHLFNHIVSGTPIWKIALYIRLSKEDGKSVSLSVVNQIKLIARYLRDFDDFEIIDIYIDDGKTGTDFDRSDFIRLEQDIANKEVNCMIVKDLTRYARNIADGIKALERFVLEQKIRFISLGIPEVDTHKNPTAISSSEVYNALSSAEDFARTTSKKVRDIKAIMREDGEPSGGFPPYGYLPNPDGGNWLYDPVAGEIKKQMYMWSAEGMSDREIAKKLNTMGIPNPTAYKQSIGLNYQHPLSAKNSGLWWPTTVKGILEDKNNIGSSVQGKSSSFDHKRHKQIRKPKDEYVIVANRHEKTVSDELFEQVAKVRGQRSRVTKKTGKVHIFAGLIYCSNCDRGMKKTGAKGHDYLVCRTYKEIGKEFCTSKRSIRFKTLEETVLKAIQMQVSLVTDLQSIVTEINKQPIVNKHSARVNQLLEGSQKALLNEEQMLDASYYDWKNGDISKEQYQRIRTEAENRLHQLKATVKMLIAEQQKMAKGIEANSTYFERFLKYRQVVSLDRLLVIDLISKIYIHEDKSIHIEFNFNDHYLLIIDFIEQNNVALIKTLKKNC